MRAYTIQMKNLVHHAQYAFLENRKQSQRLVNLLTAT
jgi:hypothetical protein